MLSLSDHESSSDWELSEDSDALERDLGRESERRADGMPAAKDAAEAEQQEEGTGLPAANDAAEDREAEKEGVGSPHLLVAAVRALSCAFDLASRSAGQTSILTNTQTHLGVFDFCASQTHKHTR